MWRLAGVQKCSFDYGCGDLRPITVHSTKHLPCNPTGATLPRPSVLVFGCRNEAGDFYFREEFEAAQHEGVLAPPPLGLLTAFSRDQSHKVGCVYALVLEILGGAPSFELATSSSGTISHAWQVYVQQRIEEHGAELWRLLSEHNAVIYVAGSADKMPAQVGSRQGCTWPALQCHWL